MNTPAEHKLVRRVNRGAGPIVFVRCLACCDFTTLVGPEIDDELAWYQAVHHQELTSA